MRGKILAGALLLMPPPALHAQWAVEGFLGTAFSANSNLSIHQAGQPTLSFTAEWATRPREPTWYYAARVSHWWGRWGAFVGYVHHKIYLTNNPPEVQDFRVTFGYNLGELGMGYRLGAWNLLGSVGPVISNPASRVRGLHFEHEDGILGGGSYLDGFNVQVGVNRRLRVVKWAFLSADVRLSAAWSQVPVANGNATVPNYALHLLLGVGLGSFRTSSP